MYVKGITILTREDLVIEKGLKKTHKGAMSFAGHGDGVGVKQDIEEIDDDPNTFFAWNQISVLKSRNLLDLKVWIFFSVSEFSNFEAA